MKIQFQATIPMIKSAILFGGDGAAQIKLEIPASERQLIKNITDLTEKVLNITMETADIQNSNFKNSNFY